jgi:hypothetical protein
MRKNRRADHIIQKKDVQKVRSKLIVVKQNLLLLLGSYSGAALAVDFGDGKS